MTARLALLTIAGCATAAPAPPPVSPSLAVGWIAGSVYLTDLAQIETAVADAPLAGVAVIARASDTGYEERTTSDAGGQYKVALPPGLYQVAFQYAGDEVSRYGVEVTREHSTPLFVTFTTNDLRRPRTRMTAR